MSQAAHGDYPPHAHGSLKKLTLGAIGVVYGDIGTSPLYAMRESLHAASHDGLTRADVMGVISLLFWTLTLIVTLKYVLLIMRADNNGEGGTLSLIALVHRALHKRPAWLIGIGAVGISLFFGNSIITPAMSVLSAVEGSALIAPGLHDYVVPITLVIIVLLFAVQSRGTEAVSVLFGPIMVVWFITMAVLGLRHISDEPSILLALNPIHALRFLVDNGFASFIVLGSVFLAVTGGEALYTDMGHFGRRPIRIAWGLLVFPALTISYLGQGAMVLAHPETASNPFFLLAPQWALLPLVILATMATVIASQAVISGAFSVAKQAVQMGLLPRMEIRHTSETQFGQIYMPRINSILSVGVVALVLAFGSSSNLASAYGIAVTGDMVITSILAIFLLNRAWKWPLALTLAVMVPLIVLEGLFLAANMTKVLDGGYIPIFFRGLPLPCHVDMGAWLCPCAREVARRFHRVRQPDAHAGEVTAGRGAGHRRIPDRRSGNGPACADAQPQAQPRPAQKELHRDGERGPGARSARGRPHRDRKGQRPLCEALFELRLSR